MDKKVTIEIGFNEALHIERALDLYTRVGLLQFDKLDSCASFNKFIIDNKLRDVYSVHINGLKDRLGYSDNSYPSIFNVIDVGDDVRIIADMLQTIRHARYKNRLDSGEQTERHYTTDEYVADVCTIANIDLPKISVTIK